MTRRREFERLVERSRRFRETAAMQMERGFYDLAAFSLEQALQLHLKASLLRLGADYPRTHSVRRLLEFLRELTGSAEVDRLLSEFSVELGSLEDAYISARYVVRDYDRGEVERLGRVVEEVIRVVDEISPGGGEAQG